MPDLEQLKEARALLMLAGFAAVYAYLCWIGYIVVMGLYRAHLAGRLPPASPQFWMALPVVILGYVMDAALQLIASVPFLDAPRYGAREWLLTARLQRYMRGKDGWRKSVARWVCTNLLDPFDPSGDHC